MLVRDSSVHVHLSIHDARVPCVRMASVLWLMHAMSHPVAAEASSHLLPRLRDTLSRVVEEAMDEPANLPASQRELFVWVATVGMLAAEQTEQQDLWFTETFMNMSRAGHIQNGEQLIVAIKRLLYIESVQGESLRRLAGKFDSRFSSEDTN